MDNLFDKIPFIIGIICVFLSGVLSGVFGYKYVQKKRIRKTIEIEMIRNILIQMTRCIQWLKHNYWYFFVRVFASSVSNSIVLLKLREV